MCENKYLTRHEDSDISKYSRGDKPFTSRYPRVYSNFFKLSLSNQKFVAMLKDANAKYDFDSRCRAENFRLTACSMQYEISEKGSCILGGSHCGLRIAQEVG